MDCASLKGRQRQLCEGTAAIPLERINLYRSKYWGLPPLSESDRPQIEIIPTPTRPKKEPKRRLTGGPGTALINSYAEKGMPHCEACYELALQMDEWGPAGCEERLEFIVSDIFPRAKLWVKENRPWIHLLLPSIVEDSAIRKRIRSDVQGAIATAREGPQAVPVEKKKVNRQRTTVSVASKPCSGCGGSKAKKPTIETGPGDKS